MQVRSRALPNVRALREKFLWQGLGTQFAQAADEVMENMAIVP